MSFGGMIQSRMDQAIVLLLILFRVIPSFSGCQLSGLEIKERPHFLSRNFTNILVSWRSNGCEESSIVRISVKHLKYLGCKDLRRDSDVIEKQVEDSGLVIVEDLHHYSNYSIKICVKEDCISQPFSTRESVPRVRVQSSPINYDHQDNESQLSFNWRPPLSSQCDKLQSESQFYHYKLLDHNGEMVRSGHLTNTHETFRDLLPGTCFTLFIYVTNSKGEYHEDYYRKEDKCTQTGMTTDQNIASSAVPEQKQEKNSSKAYLLSSPGIISLIFIGFILLCFIVIMSGWFMQKRHKRMKLRRKMEKYFEGSTSTSNTYDCPSSRTRSPTDPLPEISFSQVQEDNNIHNEEDVPGYLRLKNYMIFKPA